MVIDKTKVQNRSTKGDPVLMALPIACSNEKAAVEFMESQRWGDTPACPRCGSVNVYQMKDSKTGERQANYRWLCRDCKGAKLVCQYTVRTDTVFEDSRIELRHWCYAFWRASTSKKGVSALEIHRQTGLSYKSSLFLLHRIRFAMAPSSPSPLRGTIEADETYVGGKPRHRKIGAGRKGIRTKKAPVLALVERDGRVRTKHLANVTGRTLKDELRKHVHPSARIITDEWPGYNGVGQYFQGGHEKVCHKDGEYARGDVTTNTVESFFAIFKRGINGIYHAVSKEHLHRYLAEFEFRYNYRGLEDSQRTAAAIRSAQGKRLMYKDPE